MSDILMFLLPAFTACLVLTGIHVYLGIHVLARGVIFVDLALAQVAALGATVGLLMGVEPGSVTSYLISLGFTFAGAVLFTAAGAVLRGFKVIAPVDAMPADGAYQEQFVVWELANAPTVSAGVTLTKLDMIKF